MSTLDAAFRGCESSSVPMEQAKKKLSKERQFSSSQRLGVVEPYERFTVTKVVDYLFTRSALWSEMKLVNKGAGAVSFS